MLRPMLPSPRAPLVILLLILPTFLLLACPSDEHRAEKAREGAIQALSRGDRAAALREIEALRAVQPDTPEGAQEVALLLVQAGEAPQALRSLEEALQKWPASDPLRLALADVALLVSDSRTALAVLLPIEPESPQHAMALVMRAHAQLRLGDFGSAVETLAEAEERYPDQPEARIARIGALLNERHFDEARQALDEARAALDNPDAEEVLRGFEIQLHLAQFQDDPDAALAALRALADADPYDPRIWQALTQGMIQAGRSEEALSLLTDAIEEDPGRLFLYSPLASLLRASGRGDEARDALRALVERSPSPTAFLGLAQHHALEATDPDATRATLEEGLAAFPDDPQLLRALAETELSYADPIDPSTCGACLISLLAKNSALSRDTTYAYKSPEPKILF
jgi:predicted Zn-dependent protease